MSESNEVLAAEDSMYPSLEPKKKQPKLWLKIIKSKWPYISIGVIIIGLFVLPYTRYSILGLFIKKDYQITVIDSVTETPVSGALVSAGFNTVTTNAEGQATLKIAVGKEKYTIFKHYYAEGSGSVFVGLSKSKSTTIHLAATGRQVPLTVINKLSGKPLSGVKISILNTNAITNSLGQARITLPTKQHDYEATLSTNSFNTLVAPVEVTTAAKTNVIKMVPSGSVYYLSSATGTINVIKANLDGSDPTTELAGTGNETASTTVLSPSPDWKYLVLEAKRTGSQPELYVINTANGDLTEFDSSANSFNLIGWNNDQFVYDEIDGSEATSTVGREEIKSYNATNNQLNVLDEDQVDASTGSSVDIMSTPPYAYQSFSNFELLPDQLVYITSWNAEGGYTFANENDTIRSVEANGLDKKDYVTFSATTTGAMSMVRYQPQSLYVSVNNSQTNQTSYYTFASGAVNSASIGASTFASAYPNYFISPSGEESLWTGVGSSVNTIYTANQNGQSSKRVLVPSGFSAYGWYDNVYILLTKNGQLYIAPAGGINSPILIGAYLTSGS
jgi:hypothetical protein